MALGEKDRALEWLEKAYEDRSMTNENFALKVDPKFDTLRIDINLLVGDGAQGRS